ncbi:MAG: anthranilate synthase component I family protein [Lacipirellulaceae bacterium]
MPSQPPAACPPPLVAELPRGLRAEEVFRRLATLRHAVWFDSALRHPELGRYSYVGADPVEWFVRPVGALAPLADWDHWVSAHRAERVEGLPPWQGGFAGLLSYDLGRSLESIAATRYDEFALPAIAMGLYDTCVAFDHVEGRAWAVSHGLPEADPARRRDRASRRLEWLMDVVLADVVERDAHVLATEEPLARDRLAPCFEAPGRAGVLSNFSRDDYLHAVACVVEHLRAGDAFQVNLSQRLLTPDRGDAPGAYLRLRERNPAPFAAYLDGGGWSIASASPERFLRLDGERIETRPIKGTRPRGLTPTDDDRLGRALVDSEKDRAENVMIVDLMRNDLSRVATEASVTVSTLFGLERYAHVQHLVSVVEAELRADAGVADLLTAALPAGSITGAPKVRAQQIIAALEPTARGAYCGSMAWVGLADKAGGRQMDSSVLIRTVTAARGWRQAPVGGGVVVTSDPEAEYDETWQKAAGLLDEP